MSYKCYILSGISGAGKSTWIKNQPWYKDAVVSAADSFFMKESEYQFDSTKIAEAHEFCIRSFIESCQNSHHVVAVDNTNTTVAEIAPYYAIASAYGYDVVLVTIYIDPKRAVDKNKHGVSLPILEIMNQQLLERELPGYWWMEEIEIDCEWWTH